MELKQIKKIRNLPKYNTGTNPFSIQQPNYYNAPQYTTQPYTQKLTSDQIGQMITNPTYNPLQTTQNNSQIEVLEFGGNGDGNTVEAKIKPSSGQKVAGVIGGVADIAQGVIGTQSAVKSAGEMMANAGTSNGNVGGVGYVRQNYIDESSEKDALNGAGLSNTIGGVAKGAAAGAAFGPIGAGVGALVGGVANLFSWGSAKRKLKQRLENARQLTARINTGAQAGAMTTALQNKYYSENVNDNGVLYANNGKDIWTKEKYGRLMD